MEFKNLSDQEAINAAREMAKGLHGTVGNINTVLGILRTKLNPEQSEQIGIKEIEKQIGDVTKDLSDVENKLFNLRF